MATRSDFRCVCSIKGAERRIFSVSERTDRANAGDLIFNLKKASFTNDIPYIGKNERKIITSKISVHQSPKSKQNLLKYTEETEGKEKVVGRNFTSAIKANPPTFAPVFICRLPDMADISYNLHASYYRKLMRLGDYNPANSYLVFMIFVTASGRIFKTPAMTRDIRVRQHDFTKCSLVVMSSICAGFPTFFGTQQTLITQDPNTVPEDMKAANQALINGFDEVEAVRNFRALRARLHHGYLSILKDILKRTGGRGPEFKAPDSALGTTLA